MKSGGWLGLLSLACCVAGGCSTEREQLPPLPEALVIVDTNVPVPLVASRLRIDLYDAQGTWFDSSDVARPTVADWPASFSVFSSDESRTTQVWVRLRAYGDGRTSDYRGERFRDWDALLDASPQGDNEPRLVKGGVDVTPTTEPSPLLTIDRLLLVQLVPKQKGVVRIVLDGACVGTMSKLGPRGLPEEGAETCFAEEKTRVAVAISPFDADSAARVEKSVAGTFASDPCLPEDGTEDRICISGGGSILGTSVLSDYTPGVVQTLSPSPARFFALGKFLIDRDEVTVGRYRKAVGLSWKGPLPAPNEGPLEPLTRPDGPNVACTWSDIERDREGYALNCIDWEAARIFCQAEGGDLPTELQWEHVATIAGKDAKTRYPWGDELPTCDQTVVGRTPDTPAPVSCTKQGIGPAPYEKAAGDLSPLGVVAMGADLNEWVLDDAEPYTARCWRDAALTDARCFSANAQAHVVRGASWATPPARGTFRLSNPTLNAGAAVGFRCVYPVAQ
ncbi:MAG: serine/threonine kinase [Labilithrix sp.]|nr:serine/threonine kinase [Labilithrix sp.]